MVKCTENTANAYYDVRWTKGEFKWRGLWAFILGLILEGAFAGDFRRNIIEIVQTDGAIVYRGDYGFQSAGDVNSLIKANLEEMTKEQFEQEWIEKD
jgi:hypothetical protein